MLCYLTICHWVLFKNMNFLKNPEERAYGCTIFYFTIPCSTFHLFPITIKNNRLHWIFLYINFFLTFGGSLGQGSWMTIFNDVWCIFSNSALEEMCEFLPSSYIYKGTMSLYSHWRGNIRLTTTLLICWAKLFLIVLL